MITSASEILSVLSRADKRCAARRDEPEQDAEYLEALTASVMAHLAGKQQHRMSALESLVAAVLLGDFDRGRDLLDQAQEAVRVIQSVHTYLLGVQARVRGAA